MDSLVKEMDVLEEEAERVDDRPGTTRTTDDPFDVPRPNATRETRLVNSTINSPQLGEES